MRELDEQVHEQVLGLCPHRKSTKWVIEDGNDYDWGYTCDACKQDSKDVPSYSTDMGAAMAVLRWLADERGNVTIDYDHCNGNGVSATVRVVGWKGDDLAQLASEAADSIPLALCRVALALARDESTQDRPD